MTPDRREILEQVASGALSPAEAERLLNEPDEQNNGATGHTVTSPSPTVRRVRVEAGFGALAIVGDPEVTEAEIDGIHTVTIEGDTLVISGQTPEVMAGVPGVFTVNLGRRGRPGPRWRAVKYRSLGSGHGALRIRINPSLELDAKLDAGPMAISNIHAPVRARASAGPLTIEDVTGPMDIAVTAGAIRIRSRFAAGESRVRSDAGGIRIELDPSSDVRVIASAALGKVRLPGQPEPSKGFGSSSESVIGSGAATLRVDTAMGSINVSYDGEVDTDSGPEAPW